jgi:arylsulfatase A-like enzyme
VLDALAARGVAVRHAYSHNGYTVQSRRHIFTGSTADIRGASTLIDDFKGNGYETAYFSGQDESFGGAEQGVGFDRADAAYDARSDRDRRYSTFTTAGSLAVPHGVVTERVAAFLASRTPERPLFLYVNFHDTHFPYHHAVIEPLLAAPVLPPGAIVPSRAGDLRAMYLNTAANVDRAIGTVIERVRETTGREPGVVVLSDHGESLFDEGFLGHGYALNDAQTRVPLIVANLPLVVPEPFGQADLRVALNAALAGDSRSAPVVERRNEPVFQYLGVFDRPAQIAFTTAEGRTIYDFRADRVLLDGAWRRPDTLAPDSAARDRFLTLVHTWERMRLARGEAASAE